MQKKKFILQGNLNDEAIDRTANGYSLAAAREIEVGGLDV